MVKTAAYICKVGHAHVWQRYPGTPTVGRFHRTGSLWLIYPRRCVSISIKISQV